MRENFNAIANIGSVYSRNVADELRADNSERFENGCRQSIYRAANDSS